MLKGTVRFGFEYQGFSGTSGSLCRSDGLRPEHGHIVLKSEDLRELQILPQNIPWRPVRGMEFDGGLDIRTWLRTKGKATVTADRPAIPAPKGGGMNQFGDLIIRTFSYPDGKVLDEITYKDIYVDHGVEEITRGMANILDHETGDIRVPLTDIRRYYGKLGIFFGRINCRRKNGRWDTETIKEDGKTPFSLTEIIEFFFSLLPGSPPIDRKSELYTLVSAGSVYDPPQGLEGKGEPVAQHIEKLLERYALKPQMQPDGSYAITRRFSTGRMGARELPTAMGKFVDFTADLHYERLTSSPTDRPPAILAIGPRRVQRITVPFVAVLQDTDGRWYTIETICKRWEYDFQSLNRQVLSDTRKAYDDVQPVLGFGNDQLHEKRRGILKMAYRYYLPGFLFTNPEKGVDLLDPDIELFPLLPITDAPWYVKELDKDFFDEPPRDTAKRGDLDDFQMIGPVARGVKIDRALFTDFREVEKLYKQQVARFNEMAAFYSEQRRDYLKKVEAAGEDLLQSERVSIDTLDAKDVGVYGISLTAGALQIGGDVEKALKDLGFVLPDRERIKATSESAGAAARVQAYSKLAEQNKDRENEQRKIVQGWDVKLKEMEKSWGENHKIPLNYNRPQSLVHASFDLRSGLMKSSVPLCRVDAPFFVDGDSREVVGDGCVQVTYGVELKGSHLSAFTNFHFFADDDDDPDAVAEVKFGGCHRSGPIKCEAVPIESREYIQDNGNPVNYNECFSEAKGKCSAVLAQPRRVEGRILEVKGLRKVVLDSGVQSIQHVWDGNSALTHVAVNAPNAAMPISQPAVTKRDTGRVDLREDQQRESEG